MEGLEARLQNIDTTIAMSKRHISIRLAIVELLLDALDTDVFDEVKQITDRLSDACDLLSLVIDSLRGD